MVWYGKSYDMLWYGMVWYGMVWFSVIVNLYLFPTGVVSPTTS